MQSYIQLSVFISIIALSYIIYELIDYQTLKSHRTIMQKYLLITFTITALSIIFIYFLPGVLVNNEYEIHSFRVHTIRHDKVLEINDPLVLEEIQDLLEEIKIRRLLFTNNGTVVYDETYQVYITMFRHHDMSINHVSLLLNPDRVLGLRKDDFKYTPLKASQVATNKIYQLITHSIKNK